MTRKALVRPVASFACRIAVQGDGSAAMSTHVVRSLLNGKLPYVRCDLCDSTGYVHSADDNGSSTRPGRHPEGVDSEVCPDCYGLGHIIQDTETKTSIEDC